MPRPRTTFEREKKGPTIMLRDREETIRYMERDGQGKCS